MQVLEVRCVGNTIVSYDERGLLIKAILHNVQQLFDNRTRKTVEVEVNENITDRLYCKCDLGLKVQICIPDIHAMSLLGLQRYNQEILFQLNGK
ncbi:hypothetical protein CL632_01415 [bacterium]|jgi:hypothetical protein|nr:hypothetical protein [bacterium]MDP6571632.1 hypothetical protein [Patescibacteria group bacterium]|tara:strand:- start:5629 stop:5910 length:282 start_codon:yes stop_codon:yes gene_type:complete